MADVLIPEGVAVFSRDQIAANYTRSYALRQPLADVGPGTQPALDGANVADTLVPVYADAQVVGEATNVRGTYLKRLDALAESEGLQRLPARGAVGFVALAASAGGATVLAGAPLRDPLTGLRFQATVTGVYANGAAVPVTGIDTGPGTNLAAGTALQWLAPPVGAGPTALVVEQSDGSGLSGGADVESDVELQDRIVAKRANPPSAGNDAAYQAAVRALPNVAVQAAFTYPAIRGPGTTGVAFTLRPAMPGGSRLPNAAELAIAQAALEASFPADDGILVCTLAAQAVKPVLQVSWSRSAPGWTDAAPWPAYVAANKVHVDNGGALNATALRATTSTTTTAPQVGQTIGLFDAATLAWKRKRIATVTPIVAGKSWDLTFDTSNSASDTAFVPANGALISPWSDSLATLVAPIAAHFDTLGPGEQVAVLPDPGRRQRRQPENPAAFPSVFSNRVLGPIFALTSIGDARLLEPTVPYATTVGVPGALSYLLTFADLAAFPL